MTNFYNMGFEYAEDYSDCDEGWFALLNHDVQAHREWWSAGPGLGGYPSIAQEEMMADFEEGFLVGLDNGLPTATPDRTIKESGNG